MKAIESDGARTIGDNAVLDIRELSVYSHADTVVMVFETLDNVEHCAEFEIDDAIRFIASVNTAIDYAKNWEYPDEGVN